MKEIYQRLITIIFMSAFALACILYSQDTYVIFWGLLLVTTNYELYNTVKLKKDTNSHVIVNIVIYFAGVLNLYLFIPAIIFVYLALLLRTWSPDTFYSFGGFCISLIYLNMPMVLAVHITDNNGQYQPSIIIIIMFFVWMNDAGAYLFGRKFGKTHFTLISPKKTVEGLVGGIVFSYPVVYVVINYFPHNQISAWDWHIIYMVCVIMGVIGDLFESMIKRKFQVKDAGVLLGKHGGSIDRLDALIFAIPCVYPYIRLCLL